MDEKTQKSEARRRMHQRRAVKKVLRALLLLACAAVLCAGIARAVSPITGNQTSSDGTAARTQSMATVSYGTLNKSVFGSGSVQAASQPGVYAKTDAQIGEILVELSDDVKAGDLLVRLEDDALDAEIEQLEYELQLASDQVRTTQTHEQYEYRILYDEDGEMRFDPNTNEPLKGKYSNEITIRSPTAGRVKAIYIEPGDDALAVYRQYGAVMLLSTDGRMKVELTDLEPGLIAVGDTVNVKATGVYTQGTVVSVTRQGMDAVIQIVGDQYDMDIEATVTTLRGAAVGTGLLKINKPMAVSAYGGIIKGIAVKVGHYCSQDEVLARLVWDEAPLYLDNDQVLHDYAQALTALENAQAKREALAIVAPCDGKVASIDLSSGDTVEEGTRVLSILEDAGMTLSLTIDELDILLVSPGQKVTMTADALPDVTLSGTVQKIAPLGNAGSTVTTYDVYIALDELDERVLSGMNVSGEIVVSTVENALLIPTDALRKEKNGYCVTLSDGSIRDIEVGVMTDDKVQVLSGLTAGEIVVY